MNAVSYRLWPDRRRQCDWHYGEFCFLYVLDVLMVPVLTFAVLFFARNWDYHKLNIAFSNSRSGR
ncbi:hypothetical protein PDIG_05960 [Penicillium digitatum PHI26]|uniref:Uncharacterized protein n=2 Tax=Penicillium digitatum TaxID=36651 RepID=K9GDA0_PEND2|nr:hypothetical protein PDIP_10640 [Penicillium digitatum Pd1]EKV19099.1 hypothetical protein PDIG_05960 [Penicillium digitatum PHI26]EKV21008.1 hypothetical protein PDIP_10640 [Penicillium digitatum Pd1]